MNVTPEETSSRAPVASNALLTAAVAGLLCLSAACNPGPRPVEDATPADTAVADSPSATPDVAAAPDATSDDATADASAPDSSASADVASLPDAGGGMDASLIDGAVEDVHRVSAEAGCDVVPDRHITSTDASFGMTLEIFTAMCDRAGGFVEIHPHCGGANSCKGFSYDEGVHVWTEHTCAGLNTCNGYSCVIP